MEHNTTASCSAGEILAYPNSCPTKKAYHTPTEKKSVWRGRTGRAGSDFHACVRLHTSTPNPDPTLRTMARSSSYTPISGRTRRKPPCTGNASEPFVAMAGSVVYTRLASDSVEFVWRVGEGKGEHREGRKSTVHLLS